MTDRLGYIIGNLAGITISIPDGKIDELMATGLSAEDAFREAFLQQAERELEEIIDNDRP